MRKIIKILFIILAFFAIIFSIYIYKLHALAIEGNKIFEQRCLIVNPPLIGYKNSFLKFADSLKNPDKYSEDDIIDFFNEYVAGMRSYVEKENKWLEMQKRYINRWDFKLIEPWYMKQAGEYQWKMYEASRDHAQQILDTYDEKTPVDQADSNSEKIRERKDKYANLYFDFFEEAKAINDWRKIFARVSVPEACNEDNMVIPDTTGVLDWEEEPILVPAANLDLAS